MINWIYSNPTWLWGSVIVAAVVLVSCLGLVVFQRFVDVESRRPHNDVVGATMAIVGVAYAVLIAFIAVATWEAFSSGDKIADTEASLISDLYRDTAGLSAEKAAPIKEGLKTYLEQVIGTEWPAQQKGTLDVQLGWDTLAKIHTMVASVDPQSRGESVIQGELLRTLNELYNARRSRILAAGGAIPDVVWWIIVLGTTITIGYTYLFGVHNFRMHVAMTSLVAASMSLVIVLVVALDRPFRGELSITTEAYENVHGNIANLEK